MNNRKLWIALAIVILGSFAVLGTVGRQMISHAPPIPASVVTTEGATLMTGEDIQAGQGVWQSLGGQEVGSIWGHGAYVAPDWTADWLHRELTFILNDWAKKSAGVEFAQLPVEQQAALQARLAKEIRTNTYDGTLNRITVTPVQAAAMRQLTAYYAGVFASGRSDYAIP